MEVVFQLFLLMTGFIMMAKGADFFVDGAVNIAARLGVSQLVIGLTIVAMGTSAPEAAVSISAALKGSADITVGNIIGSNIINILVILGITSIITPLKLAPSTARIELPALIVLFFIFILFGSDGAINNIEGAIFWILFGIYLCYLFYLAKNTDTSNETFEKPFSLPMVLLAITGGAALIIFGSDITIDAAVGIAEYLGMSQRLIGLTIISIGTTLPEQVTSFTAARKGNADIAIGNIIGSCIFNILFVVGSSALVTTIPFSTEFIRDAWIAMAAAVILLLCCFRHYRLGRCAGIFLLTCYLIYFIFIIL